MLDLALSNLLTPMVLFFVLGLAAAMARSDLEVPEAITKLLVLFLLISIGFRGGAEVAHHGFSGQLAGSIGAGLLLSFGLPFLAYAWLRAATTLRPIDAAAIAGHYGSISAVTFAAVTGALAQLSMAYEGFMVAVAAAMEAPAIFAALILASRTGAQTRDTPSGVLMRDIAFNSSIVVLVGAFVIGIITGRRGLMTIKPFFIDLFPGFLCLFLLEMGLVAGRGLARGRQYLSWPIIVFALAMPIVGALLALLLAKTLQLSPGGAAVLMTLAASASYIAVPAALRLALPQANAALALTLSLGVTFPFNILLGIPLYISLAQRV